MSTAVPVITIDGPGGSGKGTIARAVAERLGWHWLDSGALYRLTALAAERRGLVAEADIAALAGALDIRFTTNPDGSERIELEGEDVTAALRTEQCGNAASRIAALPAVRAALVGLQHAFRRPPGLVADGRDMGTVIFPDAPLKVFLTASPEERARRRHNQLKDKEKGVTFAALLREIAERDARDASRAVSPLRPADDAVVIDTTRMSIEEVVAAVLNEVRTRLGIRV